MPSPVSAFERTRFEAPIDERATSFDVYRRGDGPCVVVLQELPGIGPQTLAFADRLVAAGFQVWMPHLFGPIGRTATGVNLVRVLCMRREFQLLAKRRSSAVTQWIRALCRHVRETTGAPGVGVLGMCLTGNFALTLIADDAVLAAVASQPSIPSDPSALHMSEAEVAASRAALDGKGAMFAYRFERDRLCAAGRFEAIDAAFNEDAAERVRLRTLPGKGHSVFTIDFRAEGPTQDALDEITRYFRERLSPS